jgi:DNA-binding transcriptional ArsR family regulator
MKFLDFRIIMELKKHGELSINSLAKALGKTYDTVRRHTHLLADNGFLKMRSEGRKIVVSLSDGVAARGAVALAECIEFERAVARADTELAELASTLIRSLCEKFPDTKIDLYFYGSFASERKHKADLDVFVVAPPEEKEMIKKSLPSSKRLHALVVSKEEFSVMELKQEPTVIQAILAGIHLQLPLPAHRRPIFADSAK